MDDAIQSVSVWAVGAVLVGWFLISSYYNARAKDHTSPEAKHAYNVAQLERELGLDYENESQQMEGRLFTLNQDIRAINHSLWTETHDAQNRAALMEMRENVQSEADELREKIAALRVHAPVNVDRSHLW